METTSKAVLAWYERAEPGEIFIYKMGFQLGKTAKRSAVSSGVHEVRRLYNAGMVNLYQRVSDELGAGKCRQFSYIAEKREPPAPPALAKSKEGYPVHLFRVPE